MKKPIIFSVLFFIISSISSFGQGAWTEINIDQDTGLRTGKITINESEYEIKPNTDLSGLNLAGVDLSGANLFGANLFGADLSGANLSSANMDSVDLGDADLKGASLRGAVLKNAKLGLTNLTRCDLGYVDFTDAFLFSANLIRSDLENANFDNSNLSYSDAGYANLKNANFKNSDLTRVNLKGADLTEANFEGVTGLDIIQNSDDQKIAELEAKLSEYQNERAGIVVIDSSNGEATISFNIEESEDLKNWQATGEKITKTIQLKNGKKFYRFALDK